MENKKQLRNNIKNLNLGLLGNEEDKLVLEIFETMCYTGSKAYENGYKQGRFDEKMDNLNK